MAKPMISEVLTKAGELKTKKEKIVYLRANNSLPLRSILKGSFDKSVEFNLPKGEPPYRKDDAPKGYEPSNLYKVQKRFKYFAKGGIGETKAVDEFCVKEKLKLQLNPEPMLIKDINNMKSNEEKKEMQG